MKSRALNLLDHHLSVMDQNQLAAARGGAGFEIWVFNIFK